MNLRLRAALLLVYTLLSLAAGCSSSSKRGSASDNTSSQDILLERARSEDTPDAREYESLDGLYRKRNYDGLLKRSKTFLSKYPNSIFLDQVYNLRALAYIGQKQYQFAVFQLKKALELTQNEDVRNMASYNLAYVYFELGQVDQASRAIDQVKEDSLERPDRMKLHVLKAKIAKLRKDYESSTREILAALDQVSESQGSANIEPMLGFLDDSLEQVTNVGVLEGYLKQYQEAAGVDRLLYRIGTIHFSSGNRDQAKDYFQQLVTKFPNSRYYSAALDNIRKVDFQGVVNTTRVGVLLTLSGRSASAGYKALQGIELAFKIFQPAHASHQISLVVVDDQGEQERALAALDELYFKHHVVAVIGPLVSKLAEPVGKKAQELGLPLIALTQKEASGGDYVFNAALTPEMQVKELRRYAEHIGMKTFSLLSPKGRFGEIYTNAFWDEIESGEGSIRGHETYVEDETDFRSHVDKLVGLSETDARAREVEELRLLKAATPIKGHSKKFDRMFELKPIVDFQAVFIPDEPKALGQILPTFAYRDVEGIQFLGINTWNSPDLIARAGQFAEGAVFVDGFYAGSNLPSSKKFIEDYRQTFNSEPGLIEAMSYDAGHVVASLLKSDVRSRSEMKDRISRLRDFPGVTGKISYQSGHLTKRLVFLTVKNGRIEEIAFQ
ncbi:MAG: penicillin-binding protein activator [Bdellovibrionota bacterium]